MSLDIYAEVPGWEPQADHLAPMRTSLELLPECGSWNITHNVRPMWQAIWGKSLGDLLTEYPGIRDSLPHLRKGLQMMQERPDTFRALNPPNGWGNYEQAVGLLESLVQFAEGVGDHPDATWRIWA